MRERSTPVSVLASLPGVSPVTSHRCTKLSWIAIQAAPEFRTGEDVRSVPGEMLVTEPEHRNKLIDGRNPGPSHDMNIGYLRRLRRDRRKVQRDREEHPAANQYLGILYIAW